MLGRKRRAIELIGDEHVGWRALDRNILDIGLMLHPAEGTVIRSPGPDVARIWCRTTVTQDIRQPRPAPANVANPLRGLQRLERTASTLMEGRHGVLWIGGQLREMDLRGPFEQSIDLEGPRFAVKAGNAKVAQDDHVRSRRQPCLHLVRKKRDAAKKPGRLHLGLLHGRGSMVCDPSASSVPRLPNDKHRLNYTHGDTRSDSPQPLHSPATPCILKLKLRDNSWENSCRPIGEK